MTTRLIINDCEPDDYILAMRSAKTLLRREECKDIVITYEGGSAFYAKRTMLGISVRKIIK